MDKRSVSSTSLLFTSVTAILGSGWLFSSFNTAKIAGPSAILSWLIGGLLIMFVAFVYAELTTMLPLTGSSTRIPQFTHGTLVGFIFSWIILLSYISLTPIEVQALMQYLNYFFPNMLTPMNSLSPMGYVVAGVLMFIMCVLNIYSLKWLIKANNVLTALKILIPIFISLVLLAYTYQPHHIIHAASSSFAPYGTHGLLTAIATGGVIFSFNGFKQACEMAGEAKNPKRALPIAIIGSISLCILIYIILQCSFLSSVNISNIDSGWHNLKLTNGSSPLTAIILQNHQRWLLPILYVGAVIGPMAAALIYMSGSARLLYGMSQSRYLPGFFSLMTQKGNPWFAIVISFIIGMFFFAPFPGWQEMMTFLTSLMAITYAIGPICLLALRYQVPNQARPFKLPFGRLWSVLAFYICTLLILWTGWDTLKKLAIALAVGIVVLFLNRVFSPKNQRESLHIKQSIWVWIYFIGILGLSYLSSFGHGLSVLSFNADLWIVALFCIFVSLLALKFRLKGDETRKYISELNL